MLRFGKAMNDSVKSIQAFNVGLKTASKRVSTSVTQKQAARMGAASQASEAIHRTKVYYQNQQQTKQNKGPQIDEALSELSNLLNNSVFNSLQNFADKVNSVIDVLIKLGAAYGAYKGLNSAKAAAEEIAKEFEAVIVKTGFGNLIFSNKSQYADMSTPQLRGVAAKQESLYNSSVNIEQMEDIASGIKEEANAMKAQYEESAQLLTMFNGALGDSSKEFGRMRASQIAFQDLTNEYDEMQNKIKAVQNSMGAVAEAAKKEAASMKMYDLPEFFGNIKSSMKTSITSFIAGLKVSTVALTAGFAAAIGYVVYKMYDFGKNAFPRLINYLQKPLQTVYEFVTGPLNQAFSKITSFVSTLNPAYGEQANRALEDLSAIVGKILLPVFNSMLSSLKVFTSFLSINSDRLKGTIQALANVIANMGAVLIGRFFILLGQAQPILEQLTAAFQRAIPVINNSLVKLFKEVQKYIPTFIQAINSLGMMLEMYLKQKLQEFANEAALASKAAQNQARAMQLFGNEAMTLSMAFNNLGYYLADFMLQLEAVIIELMGLVNFIVGRPQQGGIIGGLDVAGKVDERNLNIGEKAGAGVRKWIAGLFGAEDMPWVAKQPKPKPAAGEGEFGDNIAGGDFGPGADLNLQEGFAAKGAAFQEIGQLGKNLAAASFGTGASVEDQQLNVQQQILQGVNGMLQNQNQFNGAAPVQGVR
jgi:hypothetical protein